MTTYLSLARRIGMAVTLKGLSILRWVARVEKSWYNREVSGLQYKIGR